MTNSLACRDMGRFGEDLAAINASGRSLLAVDAAARLVDELGRARCENTVVVTLGCGVGLSSARLLSEHFAVTGIDGSSEMLDMAQRLAPRATFIKESWVTAEIPACNAVLASDEVINDAPDGVTLRHVERLFARVFRSLSPGGLFLFDAAGPGRFPIGETHVDIEMGDTWGVIVESSEDRRGTLTRSTTTLRKVDGRLRVSEEAGRQRLLPQAKVLTMLRKAGFRARAFHGYNGDRVAPGHSVYAARRP